MKIIVIGASGTIGQAVTEALAGRHEIIRVGHTQGDFQVELASRESLERLFEAVAPFDALVSAAGAARFRPMETLTDDDFAFSLSNKLMGQVNLVRLGLHHISDHGSFTLTSGVLAQEPMPGSWIVVSPTVIASEATTKNQPPDIDIIVFQTSPGTANGTSRRQKRCQGESRNRRAASSRSAGTVRSDW